MQHYRQKLENQVKKTDTSTRTKKDKWVINLSKHTLTKDESKVLARGLHFALSLNVIPKQQILAEIEKGIQKLPEHSANLIRNQVVSVLNNKRKSEKNLINSEKKALIDLSKNNEISICKADKGNCTVILYRTDKLLQLLKDETTYKAMKQGQTKSIERRLNAFIFDLFKT